MDRMNLSRKEIVEILVADAPWHPLQVQGIVEDDDESDLSARFWQHVHGQMADARAERLLDPGRLGTLLDHQTAKHRLLPIGRQFGWFGDPLLRATGAIESAVADVLLAISSIDFVETRESCWERLCAIVQMAQLYHAPRVPDFLRSGVGREMILRLSTTPEAFREHQRALMDAKRPEVVEGYLNRLREVVRDFARARGRDVESRLLFDFPRGQDFWAVRAWWLHWVEVQIDRAWPGCALGSTQAPKTDA